MRIIKSGFMMASIAMVFTGCTVKNLGEKYSQQLSTNVTESPKEPVVKIERESCSFKGYSDITVPVTDKPYSGETEQLISDLYTTYVSGLQITAAGHVDYKKWRESKDDLGSLCIVLKNFENTDVSKLAGDEKMAFYINAYNVMTIELILQNYLDMQDPEGIRSIRNIKGPSADGQIKALGDNVWDAFTWKIGADQLSLNDVEHKILRKMGDARVHMAINCASKSCPPLRNEAFVADKLNEQLDEMATFFVNNESYNKYVYDEEFEEGEFKVSRIFDWFRKDFSGAVDGPYKDVRSFIIYYLNKGGYSSPYFSQFVDEDLWFFNFRDYNWSLNETVLEDI